MNVNYSEVASIAAYIPEVKSGQCAYPYVACNIDNIDDLLMSWTDPDRPYDYYNLTKDVQGIFEGTAYSPARHCFSQIKHWIPSENAGFDDESEGEVDMSQLTQGTEE